MRAVPFEDPDAWKVAETVFPLCPDGVELWLFQALLSFEVTGFGQSCDQSDVVSP